MQFWFDFASTYSYPAALRVEALARQQGISLEWKAFLLGPIFQAQGWNDSPFNLFPVQGRYMWRDLERICADLELPFRRPSQFPRNSVLAARVACRFAAEPWLPDFVRAVFRANFADDRDISQPMVLERCLAGLDLPGAALLQEARSPANKALLRVQTEQAVALGIFGAPTFLVGDEMFWGNDRLDMALTWATRHGGGLHQ
ncbi:MAG: 2-hydroxychromene-2-carboxylate isomerase [Candidatus Competibacter sp.]|nr:2-hydroxychromene-2-carboxylate isomerase [Candidatus Competibacter sp.]